MKITDLETKRYLIHSILTQLDRGDYSWITTLSDDEREVVREYLGGDFELKHKVEEKNETRTGK